MDIAEKTLKGFAWIGLAKIIQQSITWVITITLARILLPSDYGLMAMANLTVYFMNFFNELSIGAAIVQGKELNDSYLKNAFTFVFFMSICMYFLLYFSSPFIGSFFNQAGLADILKLLGFNFVICAFWLIPHSMITRRLEFDKIAKTDFVANIIMGITSLTLAFSGFGVWSLVYGFLLRNITFTVMLTYFYPWKPRFGFSMNNMSHLLRFGLPVTGSKILSYISYYSDNFIVGKFLGDKLLGYYYMAFHLATMPVDKLSLIIYQIYFPTSAKLQDDKEKTIKYFLGTTKYVALVIFPLLTLLAFVADDIIPVLLGSKWLSIVYPLKLLCIVGMLRALSITILPILMGRGEVNVTFWYSVVSTMIMTAAFIIFGINYGIIGVVSAWLFIYPFLVLWLILIILKKLNISLIQFIKSLLPSLKALVPMIFVLISFKHIFDTDIQLIRLIGNISVGGISYLIFLFTINKELRGELGRIMMVLKIRRPEKVPGLE